MNIENKLSLFVSIIHSKEGNQKSHLRNRFFFDKKQFTNYLIFTLARACRKSKFVFFVSIHFFCSSKRNEPKKKIPSKRDYVIFEKNSQMHIPALTEILSECFVPNCGISITVSDRLTTSCCTPLTSFPKIRAYLFVDSGLKS